MQSLPAPPAVRLVPWHQLTAPQRDDVRGLSLDAAQVEYAGTLERALNGMDAGSHEQLGVAILSSDTVVGLLLLKRGSRAPAWAHAHSTVISSMRVDRRHQGMGYGSAALASLRDWVRHFWPDAGHLALSVDEENARGIAAYARAGFIDTGRRDAGRIGWVRYMVLPESAPSGIASA
jgi:RimJ/RimL family protein N-acetyltransferase